MSLTRWSEYGGKLGACPLPHHTMATLLTTCDGNRHFPFSAPTPVLPQLSHVLAINLVPPRNYARNFLLAFRLITQGPRCREGIIDEPCTQG